MLSDIILVESKSASETHHAQKVFEKLGIHKMQGVSKYCLGLLCEEAVTTKYKRFERVLQHIQQLQQNSI